MGIFKSAAKSGFSLKKDKEVSNGRTKLASTPVSYTHLTLPTIYSV